MIGCPWFMQGFGYCVISQIIQTSIVTRDPVVWQLDSGCVAHLRWQNHKTPVKSNDLKIEAVEPGSTINGISNGSLGSEFANWSKTGMSSSNQIETSKSWWLNQMEPPLIMLNNFFCYVIIFSSWLNVLENVNHFI